MFERILLVAFLVSPLVLWTTLPYPHTFPRFVWLAVICTALILKEMSHRRALTLNKIDGAFFIFIAALGVSTFFSTDITYSLWGSMERSFGFALWIFLLCAYLVLRHAWHDPTAARLIWRTSVAVLALMSLWGVAQALIPGFATTFSGSRIGGTLGNAIFFGMYLSLSIGWTVLYLAAQTKFQTRTEKIIVTFVALLTFINLWLTKSTGATLGLGVGISAAVTLFVFLKTRRKIIPIIAAVLIIGALFAGWYAYSHNLFRTETLTTRIIHWRMSVASLRTHPLFGYGFERYGAAANEFFDPALTQQALSETNADKPHNTQLELAVTTGIFGIIAYTILIFTVLISLWLLHKKAVLLSGEFSILVGIFIGREVQNAAAFETHGTALVFVLLLSYCAYRLDGIPHKHHIRLHKNSIAALAIVSVGLMLFGALRPLTDAIALTKLDQRTVAPAPQPPLTKLFDHARQSPYPATLFEAISHTVVGRFWQRPDNVRTWTRAVRTEWNNEAAQLRLLIDDLSKIHSTDGLWNLRLGKSSFQLFSITQEPTDAARAISYLTHARTSSPGRQEPIMLLGQIELQRNNPAAAIAYFDAAIAINEKLGLAHWYRGMAQIAAGEPALVWWNSLRTGLKNGYNTSSEQVIQFIYNNLIKAGLTAEAVEYVQILNE